MKNKKLAYILIILITIIYISVFNIILSYNLQDALNIVLNEKQGELIKPILILILSHFLYVIILYFNKVYIDKFYHVTYKKNMDLFFTDILKNKNIEERGNVGEEFTNLTTDVSNYSGFYPYVVLPLMSLIHTLIFRKNLKLIFLRKKNIKKLISKAYQI